MRTVDPREALATALGRSGAQTLATDADAEGRLLREFQRVTADLDAAARACSHAIRTRVDLERKLPYPLAFRTRRRHEDRLAQARAVEAAAKTHRDKVSEREA